MNLAALVERVAMLRATDDVSSDQYEGAVFALWGALNSGHRDVLRQVLAKPTWDGDICSKSSRDDLIALGLAERCCFDFEDGYTTATYMAGSVWRIMNRATAIRRRA